MERKMSCSSCLIYWKQWNSTLNKRGEIWRNLLTKPNSFQSRSPQSHEDTKFVNFPEYTMRCYLIIGWDKLSRVHFLWFFWDNQKDIPVKIIIMKRGSLFRINLTKIITILIIPTCLKQGELQGTLNFTS